MDKKFILIISGFNQRAVVAFCRFAINNNINFVIVASGENDPILRSYFNRNVIAVRESRELKKEDFQKYRDKMQSIRRCDEILLFPSTEYFNRFLLDERDFLEANGFIIPLCSKNLYELLSDKYSFAMLCKNTGILVPVEYDNVESARLPFVAKPKKYFNNDNLVNQKPHIYYTQEDLIKFPVRNDADDFYFQQFIGGHSYYLLFYFSKDDHISCYSQENLMQQDNGLSIIAARSSDVHHNSISKDFSSILQAQNFRGLVMIEVKFFNNEYYMIEANPRVWGPSQLILDAQMDLFHRFSADYGLIDEVPALTYKTGVKYFWSGGLIQESRMNRKVKFYNYTESDFVEDYASLMAKDIYLKEDTIEIYKTESIK